MSFKNWIILNESNLLDLYKSTVKAFPETKKRQHAIDTIKITEIQWNPFLGVKTLFVKGFAENTETGKQYNPIIVFKNVEYSKSANSPVELIASDGKKYSLEKISNENDVLIRCNCADFSWRFNYFDHQDKSLYGRVRKKYVAKNMPETANPLGLPGMCKHLIKLVKTINQTGLLEE